MGRHHGLRPKQGVLNRQERIYKAATDNIAPFQRAPRLLQHPKTLRGKDITMSKMCVEKNPKKQTPPLSKSAAARGEANTARQQLSIWRGEHLLRDTSTLTWSEKSSLWLQFLTTQTQGVNGIHTNEVVSITEYALHSFKNEKYE